MQKTTTQKWADDNGPAGYSVQQIEGKDTWVRVGWGHVGSQGKNNRPQSVRVHVFVDI